MNIDEKTISFNDKLSRNLQGEEVYLEMNQRTAARTECQTRITVGGGSRTFFCRCAHFRAPTNNLILAPAWREVRAAGSTGGRNPSVFFFGPGSPGILFVFLAVFFLWSVCQKIPRTHPPKCIEADNNTKAPVLPPPILCAGRVSFWRF